tara:strand:- start:322 stop:522 length:201 start_codon:yes stop_codon:yes gene_type:complete
MNQIELISYYTEQLKKVLVSNGADSEYFTVAFYHLQGAKMGLPLEELFNWASDEAKRLYQIRLDKL